MKKCSVAGCQKPLKAKGFCAMHHERQRVGRPLDHQRALQTGSAGPTWKGDDISYAAAHYRVRRLRGRAADHPCGRCDNLAVDWAYDHLDPNERRQQDRRDANIPYSLDPYHYLALCRSCHTTLDHQQESPSGYSSARYRKEKESATA
jgi:hypothetical protein